MKKPTSPISTLTNRHLIRAVGLSLALHAPLLMQNREVEEVVDQSGNIAYVTKENAKSILNSRPREKREYVEQLKEALEKGEYIDLGEFYLKTQYLDGRLDEDRMREASGELASVEAEMRVDKKKLETLDVLQGITSREGEYSEPNSYLSTLLLEGGGNCKARERFASALVDRLYPDMEIVYQKVKVDGGPHTRALVKVAGEWRNMENPKAAPLTEDDLAGTVLFSKYDYVKHYVGQSDLGVYKKPSAPIDAHTKLLSTDDYLAPPLPGVDFDNIKDVDSGGSEEGGVGVGSVGQGVIGSPAPAGKNGESSMWGAGFARDPIEFEILTAEDIEKNRQRTEATLEHWRGLSVASSAELKRIVNTILPNMPNTNDTCIDNISLFNVIQMGGKNLIQFCKMDKTSGLLSCEYDIARGIIPGGAEEVDYVGLGCLPKNLERCSGHKKNDFFSVDDFLKIVFVLALEDQYKDRLHGEIDSKREVRRVALKYGILDPLVFEKLVVAIHHEGYQFFTVANRLANLKHPTKGTPRFFKVGTTFDDFYCDVVE